MAAEAISAPQLPRAQERVSAVRATTDPVASSQASAQARWAAMPMRDRLEILKRTRHSLAQHAEELAAAMTPELARTPADTLVAEVLPLLEAIGFLERQAARVLATRRLGRAGRPLWLRGVDSEIRRVPFGNILVIGPANYPLFLPGVQILQALAAGNAVTWKPGRGGAAVAQLCAQLLADAGLPRDLLTVTDDTVEAAEDALDARPDKVIFTGSGATGRVLLRKLAETATPSVMELSGCDAVLVLPSADLARTARALTFGMRLNGSATCMAPRRLILAGLSQPQRSALLELLAQQFSAVPAITLSPAVEQQLTELLDDAQQLGGVVLGEHNGSTTKPLLILHGRPEMALARADLFAPVLTVFETASLDEAVVLESDSLLTLTTSIFTGDEGLARTLAGRLSAPTILINDLIALTADPRLPFGGRGASGFGATRGADGLLEMTRPKVVSHRRNREARHYDPTDQRHASLFAGLNAALHGGSFATRWSGIRRILAAARSLRSNS